MTKRLPLLTTITIVMVLPPYQVGCHRFFYGCVQTFVILGQSDGCVQPGCYEDEINYNVEINQIESIIEISETCEQTILHNCTNNAISH